MRKKIGVLTLALFICFPWTAKALDRSTIEVTAVFANDVIQLTYDIVEDVNLLKDANLSKSWQGLQSHAYRLRLLCSNYGNLPVTDWPVAYFQEELDGIQKSLNSIVALLEHHKQTATVKEVKKIIERCGDIIFKWDSKETMLV
jgi:hypothetical protein